MEFRRISTLPPYVFTIINNLKVEARRAGRDVIDLGFGNPDIPSPDIAVQKLAEAATKPANHRYSMSRGLPKLREAIAGYYQRTWGVELDVETEITNTIGSKEGFSHLMWVLLEHGGRGHRAEPQLPDPHLRTVVRRRRPPPGADAITCSSRRARLVRRGVLRSPDDGLRHRLAETHACWSSRFPTTRRALAWSSSSCSASLTSAASGR